MAPKRGADQGDGGGAAKKTKLSTKRLDKLLGSLEQETQNARFQEQREFVMQEMLLSPSLSDQCYGFACKNKKIGRQKINFIEIQPKWVRLHFVVKGILFPHADV